jgi:divalent metal cation (Fe/Co/Zn/Cd) transporter
VAAVLEFTSWLQARKQLRRDARRMRRGFRHQLWATSDPAATTVFAEDSAALIGLALAGTGVGLHQLTGNAYWDSLASIAIGALLAVVAVVLGRENKSLIIGESADPRLVEAVRTELAAYPQVSAVDDVLTMVLGRGEVLVAARVDFDDDLHAGELESVARRMEREIAGNHPPVRHFFLDITADSNTPDGGAAVDPAEA